MGYHIENEVDRDLHVWLYLLLQFLKYGVNVQDFLLPFDIKSQNDTGNKISTPNNIWNIHH